jgi:hypothetical protein
MLIQSFLILLTTQVFSIDSSSNHLDREMNKLAAELVEISKRPLMPSEVRESEDGDVYINPNGTLYLFEERGNQVLRHDLSVYHGAFFDRYFFIHQGVPFILGGEGLFLRHSNLLMFDSANSDWRRIKAFSSEAHHLKMAWLEHDDLNFLLDMDGQYSFGTYNLKTFDFELNDIKINKGTSIHMLENAQFLEGPELIIWLDYEQDQNAVILFEKKTREFKTVTDIDLPAKDVSLTRSSTISEEYVLLAFMNGEKKRFHIDEFQPLDKIKNSKPSRILYFLLAISIGLLLNFLIAYRYFSLIKQDDLLAKLVHFIGEPISVIQMNELLGIEGDIEFVKLKRHQILSQVNQTGLVQINRERNQEDQRFVSYVLRPTGIYKILIRPFHSKLLRLLRII